ncbi:MAG: deoxyribose-phosphate aldolase [Bacilli bacterium]|nr:deoxyribose-phosphate aldolase [Bacilli bacterium]
MKYNKLIDHTLLSPTATKAQIEKLCQEAKDNNFASVCVNGDYVELASHLLHVENCDVKVCTVVGFPLGSMSTTAKVLEARQAIFDGADEIDMVINVSWLKDKEYERLAYELGRMRRQCQNRVLKVILETCLLSDEEIVKACQLCKEAGADFVKTSTGFSTGGATVHAVKLMRKTVGPEMGVKAAGGIRTRKDLEDLVAAGATRIGTSHGIDLVK